MHNLSFHVIEIFVKHIYRTQTNNAQIVKKTEQDSCNVI